MASPPTPRRRLSVEALVLALSEQVEHRAFPGLAGERDGLQVGERRRGWERALGEHEGLALHTYVLGKPLIPRKGLRAREEEMRAGDTEKRG